MLIDNQRQTGYLIAAHSEVKMIAVAGSKLILPQRASSAQFGALLYSPEPGRAVLKIALTDGIPVAWYLLAPSK